MLKKITSIILALIITASVFGMSFNASAITYKQELINKGFPESYADALVTLHNKYPNWVFEPFKTELDWQTAVNGERSSHSKQVIQKSSSYGDAYYCQCEKCKPNGTYKIQEGSSWVSASEQAVKYFMDPRNWLSEEYIFQFESTSYASNQTIAGVESIISTTWMKDANITYKSTEGQSLTYKDSKGNTVKYSQAIINAAKNSGMSAYYLASKIRQEVGSLSPTTGGSCGTKSPFIGMYNYYNIGANTGYMAGLEWASGFLRTNKETTAYTYDSNKKEFVALKDEKGNVRKLKSEQYLSYISKSGNYYKGMLYETDTFKTSGEVVWVLADDLRTTYFNYGRPWTNPYLTIYYGAEYIKNGFSTYQNTGYLQKFNVNKNSSSLYNHEYMANVDAAKSEAKTTYNAYKNANILSSAKTFYIPVFNNMPSAKCTVTSGGASSQTTAASNPVTGLTLSGRTTSSLTFKWNKLSGATKYYVYVKNVTKGTSFNKTVTTNSATLNGLTPANKYEVWVKAYTSKGWQDYSPSVAAHATPDKMATPKISSVGDTYATLTWSTKTGADGYHIYSYNSSTKKYTLLANVKNGKTSSVRVNSLVSASKNTLCIRAYVVDSSTVAGTLSDKVSTTTKPRTPTLKSVSSPSSTKIKATWSAATGGEGGYEIYYGKDKNFKKLAAKKVIKSKKTVSYTGKNFTKGKTYYVKVRSYRTVNGKKKYSSWSAVKSVKCK
jgi:hypothetical protein